jgi:hypothetical protein
MKLFPCLVVVLLFFAFAPHSAEPEGGITPEQIYQAKIDENLLIGTWEVLPDENPLEEKVKRNQKPTHRMLMALRKDGTCRVFNEDHPAGSDGLWTFEDHKMFISLPGGSAIEYYVYGVKGDFMVTRSQGKDGRDQLWSRVK